MMGEHSIVSLVLHASLIVQFVLLLLLGASVVSWAIILRKRRVLGEARSTTDEFEERFWSGVDLAVLYKALDATANTGMSAIFVSGFREFSRLRHQVGISGAHLLEGSRRAMRVAQLKETDRLEQNLATLATIGSTSPYVGLFGTVWGIMNAFRGLANVSQATLAHVAPGIAEALIATAIGLFAAIPAVVAYNRYTHDVDRLAVRFETFIEEFSNILQRQG